MALNCHSKELFLVTTSESLKYRNSKKIYGCHEILICITLMIYGEHLLQTCKKNNNANYNKGLVKLKSSIVTLKYFGT